MVHDQYDIIIHVCANKKYWQILIWCREGQVSSWFVHMQVFDLDLDTERDTAITLKGLKTENRVVVDNIDKFDPANMTIVQLKSLEKRIDAVV